MALRAAWKQDDRSVPRELRVTHLLGVIYRRKYLYLFGALAEWVQHVETRTHRLERRLAKLEKAMNDHS